MVANSKIGYSLNHRLFYPFIFDNPILHKHKRKELVVLSRQFMVNCCLQILQRDDNGSKVFARLLLSINTLFQR